MFHRTVRLRETAYKKLRRLAHLEQRAMIDVLDDVIEAYRRTRFLSEMNAGYAELRRDPLAAAVFQELIANFDDTLLDGLDPVVP